MPLHGHSNEQRQKFLVLPMHFSNTLVTVNIISEYFNMICFISIEFPGSVC